MAQKRLEWLNRDFKKKYVRHKKNRAEEGSGEQRIRTAMKLEYDMYGLIYLTTLHPEYLYVLKKARQDEDAAKKAALAVPNDGKDRSTGWMKKFDHASINLSKIPWDIAD